MEEEKKKYQLEMEAARNIQGVRQVPATEFSIISFALVCFVGYLIGSIKVYMGPLGYVSLESTGGVLIAALLLGYIGKIGPISFRMDTKVLGIIRELGLAFFLAIVGLNYGYGAVDALTGSGITLALVSLFGRGIDYGWIFGWTLSVQAQLDHAVRSDLWRYDFHAGFRRGDRRGRQRRTGRGLRRDVSVCFVWNGHLYDHT